MQRVLTGIWKKRSEVTEMKLIPGMALSRPFSSRELSVSGLFPTDLRKQQIKLHGNSRMQRQDSQILLSQI